MKRHPSVSSYASFAAVTAAALVLTGCSAFGGQSTDAACELVSEAIVGPLSNTKSAEDLQAEMLRTGEMPNFTETFDAVSEALTEIRPQVTNTEVAAAIDKSVSGITAYSEFVAGLKFSGVDLSSPESLEQTYQLIDAKIVSSPEAAVANAEVTKLGTTCGFIER